MDRTGLHKTFVGNLPSQSAALNMTNINVQRLTVEATLTGDTEKIVQACALDPLTSAVLTLKEIRDMAADMLEAERQWLPQFVGKTIRATPTIVVPKDVKPAQVPIDPTLAIYRGLGCWGSNVMRDACYVIVLAMGDLPFDARNTQYKTSRSTKHVSR